jgi:hypothetical protein
MNHGPLPQADMAARLGVVKFSADLATEQDG